MAPYTHQVFITSEPTVNKSKRDVNLLIEHLLLPNKKPFQLQTNKLKPKHQPLKDAFKQCPATKPMEDSKINKKTHVEDITFKEYNKE